MEKDNIYQIFKKFDLDGDGQIEKKEIEKIAKELGQNLTPTELNQVYALIDTDGDGKISFDEFYFWWKYGKMNKLAELAYFKMEAQKNLFKLDAKFKKLNEKFNNNNNNNNEEQKQQYQQQQQQQQQQGPGQEDQSEQLFFSFNIGDQPPNSYAGIKFFFGQEHILAHTQLCQGLEDLKPHIPAIIFKIKVNNYDQAHQEFKQLIDTALVLAEELLPPEIAQNVLPHIKVDYCQPQAEYLSICISINTEFFQDMINSFMTILDVLPKNFSSSLHLYLGICHSVQQIVDKADQPINQTIGQSINLNADIKLEKNMTNILRQAAYASLLKKQETGNMSYKLKRLKPFFPFLLMNSAKISLNFKNLDDALLQQEIDAGQLPPIWSVNQFIGVIKPELHLNELISSIPIAEQLIQVLKQYCSADFSITVCALKCSLQFYVNTDGLGSLFDLLL